MMNQAQEKLQLGLERLQKADNDPDILGSALLSFHGALEDHFRDVLEYTSALPSEQRARVQDSRQVQWKELIDLMQQYHHLNDSHKHWILSMNRLRQGAGHGGRFTGNQTEIEKYGEFVRTQINGVTSSRPSVKQRQHNSSTNSVQAVGFRAEKQLDRGNSDTFIKLGCMSIGVFIFAVAIVYSVLATLGSFLDLQRIDRNKVPVSEEQDRVTSADRKSEQEDYRGTLAGYDREIAVNPNSTVAYTSRGSLKSHHFNDDLGALADYDRAIELDPNYLGVADKS